MPILFPINNKIIGVIGSRRRKSVFDRNKVVNKFFEIYKDGDWIVSGGCELGGDKFADEIAREYGIPIITFYPYWKKYGKPAGFIRNTDVAQCADVLIACVAKDRKDRKGGTEDTIEKFEKKNKKAILV